MASHDRLPKVQTWAHSVCRLQRAWHTSSGRTTFIGTCEQLMSWSRTPSCARLQTLASPESSKTTSTQRGKVCTWSYRAFSMRAYGALPAPSTPCLMPSSSPPLHQPTMCSLPSHRPPCLHLQDRALLCSQYVYETSCQDTVKAMFSSDGYEPLAVP